MITQESLRNALVAHIGQALTPEMAAAIEMAAIDRADCAMAPERFAPRAYKDVTFQVESFRKIVDALHGLHAAHYAETERHLQGIPMAPDYGFMAESERLGKLLQFTARNAAGELVGNCRMYLATSMHTGQLLANEDTLFLLPAYRKGRIAVELLRYVERNLVEVVGVQEIRANSKVVNKAHRLMEYMGYTHVANNYVKNF